MQSAHYTQPMPPGDSKLRMNPLPIGAVAPDFELPDQDGRPLRLSLQLSRGPVLLYFYPADFTPVCTREACAFRDLYPQLAQHDTQLIGISPQDSDTHARFRENHCLPFTLLSDCSRRVIRAYGCGCIGLPGLGVRRVSYLIGRNGRIADRVRSAFRVKRHAALARRALERA